MNYKEQIQTPGCSTDSMTSQGSDYSTDNMTSQSEHDESTASGTESTSTTEEDEEKRPHTNLFDVKLKDKDFMWKQLKELENQTFLQNKAIWEAVELQQRIERKKIFKKLKELESRINMKISCPDTQPKGDVCHRPKSGCDPIPPNIRTDANWKTTSAYQLPCLPDPSDLSSSVFSNRPQTPFTPTHLPKPGSGRTAKQKNQVFPDTKQTYVQSSDKATYSAGERRRIRKARSCKSGLPGFLPAQGGVEKKEVDYTLFCKSVHQSSPLPKTKECTVPLPAHKYLSEEKLKKDTDAIWKELKQLENRTLLQHQAILATVESKRQENRTEILLQQSLEKKIYRKLKTLESKIDMQSVSPDAQPKREALSREAILPPTPQTPDQDDTASVCHLQMTVHSNPSHSVPDARTIANWRRKSHSFWDDDTSFGAHQSTSAHQFPCLPDPSNLSSSMLSNRPQTPPTPMRLPISDSIAALDPKKMVLEETERSSKSGEERGQALFEYSPLYIQCPLPNEDGMEKKEVESALDCRSGRPLPPPPRVTERTYPSEVQKVKQPRSLPCSPLRVNKTPCTRKPHIISSESVAQENHNEKDMEWKSLGQIADETHDMPPPEAEIELLKSPKKTVKSFHEETNADKVLLESQKKVKDLDREKQIKEAKQLQRKNKMKLLNEMKERAIKEEQQQKEDNLKLHDTIKKEKLKLETLIRIKTKQKEMEARERRQKKKLEKCMLERQKNTEAERNKIKEREKKEREKQNEIILEREKQAQKKTKKIEVKEKKEKERQDQIILEKEKQAEKERQKIEERERKKREKQEKCRLKMEKEKEKERIKILKKAKKEKENEEKRQEAELNKRIEQQKKMEKVKLEAQAKALKKERIERERILKTEEKDEKKKEKKEKKEFEKRQKKILKREKERAHLERALQKIKNAEIKLRRKDGWKNRGAEENLEQSIEKELEFQKAKKMEEKMDNKKKEKSQLGWKLPKVSVRIRSWSEMFPKKNKGDRKNI